MFSFRLAPVVEAHPSSDLLSCLEIAALFRGKANVGNLPIDDELCSEWYIRDVVAEESRADYAVEREMAIGEMREYLSSSLIKMAQERKALFGGAYPFELDNGTDLVSKPIQEISHLAHCYLALQLFRAVKAELIEIEPTADKNADQIKSSYQRLFEKVFEYISGYAVAGQMSGLPYMTSDCRSSERLHSMLVAMCQRFGFGVVHPRANWNALQLAANDGGVDCLVRVGLPAVDGNAFVALVGASVQADAKPKIIDTTKKNFFGSFFSQRPAAFIGVLARPQDNHELTRLKCMDADCLLYSYEEICVGMASSAKELGGHAGIRRLDAKVRNLLEPLRQLKLLDDYEECSLV
jgi:hypothetical protein